MRTLQYVLHGVHRRFWIVGATTIVVCAALMARAAGHVVEARYLGDARQAAPLPFAASQPEPSIAVPQHDSKALVERNMFCSDCAGGVGDPVVSAPDGATPRTALPLSLIATSLGATPVATLRHTGTGAQGAYGVGDVIPGAGPVVRVAGTWIDFTNTAANRVERVDLLDTTPPPKPPDVVTTAKPVATKDAPPWADRVRKIDDNTVEVDRSLVRDLVGAGSKVDGVRIVPATKGNEVLGFRVAAARPGSLGAALGLRPGDLIQSIDGVKIDSAQQMIDLYAKLDDLSSLRFEGTRRGEKLSLELRLR
jgi:type II secretory pathway component PulC